MSFQCPDLPSASGRLAENALLGSSGGAGERGMKAWANSRLLCEKGSSVRGPLRGKGEGGDAQRKTAGLSALQALSIPPPASLS